jgi:hypothetical protein
VHAEEKGRLMCKLIVDSALLIERFEKVQGMLLQAHEATEP